MIVMEDLTEHKEQMVAFMQKQKQKRRRKLPPPPKDFELFDIKTANKQELDKEFVRKKIRMTEVRTMASELDLGRIREELIEKELVLRQLRYIFVAFRQKVLAMPTAYARKLTHKENVKEVHRILKEMANALLNDLSQLPHMVEPDWLERLEEEEQNGDK